MFTLNSNTDTESKDFKKNRKEFLKLLEEYRERLRLV